MRRRLAAAVVVFALSGCATQFYGSPTVPNGRAGCEAVCQGWGMDLAGMVAMGEYSNGCICQVKGKNLAGGAAASSAAIAGVAMQMQRAQQQAAAAASMHH